MYLVAGASGNIGGEVARALLGAGERVRVVTRRPGGGGLPAGAEPVVADLNRPETVAAGLDGARGVFLLSGYEGMEELLARARAAGVERVVLLSGSSAEVPAESNALSRYMVRSEDDVRASGLAWTILRPRSFMSNTMRWLPQLRDGDVVRAPFGDVPVALVDPADVGATASRALLDEGHDGATYALTGPEALRPADRVRILGEVLGRELRFDAQTDAEAREDMSRTTPAEYVDAFMLFFAEGAVDETTVHPGVRRVTGREPRSFRRWAEAHAAAFA